MCLAIPGQVIEFVDEANRLAKVDVAGVRRNVNVGLLDDDGGGAQPGDWVLIHVGFALSKVDEEEAHATLALLAADGRGVRAGARGAEGERDRVSEALPACIATRQLHHLRRRRRRACAWSASTRRAASRVCADEAGASDARSTTELVAPVAPGDRAARPRRRRARALAREAARMRFVDEFRDAELGRALAGEILATSSPAATTRSWRSAAGTRTRSTSTGSTTCCPPNVELVHGPGCPVCVIPMGRVDDGIAIAHEPGVIFTCFGDMLRVPGADGTLLDAKAAGRRRARWSTRRSTRCGSRRRTPTARSSSSRSASRRRRPRPR